MHYYSLSDICLHMKRKRIRVVQTINELLGMTPEQYSDVLSVTLAGYNTALVKGFDLMCEYSAQRVSFLRRNTLCEINGDNLELCGLSADAVQVTGEIRSVCYSEVGV